MNPSWWTEITVVFDSVLLFKLQPILAACIAKNWNDGNRRIAHRYVLFNPAVFPP